MILQRRSAVFLFVIISLVANVLYAQNKKTVYTFSLKEEIGPSAWRTTKKALANAEAGKAQVILLKMNTFGGMVDYADSIRTALLGTKIKTIVFIDNNAASAGALIAIACDKIYMRKGASIGAASVVNPKGEIMPEKYQSYMRGLMRTTAETKGRDPRIAEAFVDPDVNIDSLKPKGKVLTLTTLEAIKTGYCAGMADNIDDVLKAEGYIDYIVTNHQVSWADRMISLLISPAISGLLILLIIGGIYFEMQSPGIGFALLVAVVAALLFFAPLYLEGLAANWEIALFIIGVLLIALEIFVIPGFGVVGILGLIFIISALTLSLVMNNFFDFTVTGSERLSGAFLLVVGSIIASIVLCVIFGRAILKTSVFQRLVLQDEQRSQMGYSVSRSNPELEAKIGIAYTDLRPSGKVEIEGKYYDAVAMDGYIEKGSRIFIEKQENYNLFVRKKT
ncbi:MAG TPA: NfeD family protein [Sphingobacteriaceae bacterium]|nr:NfeD family protein [Sphingobacteriaceae bacterium]